MIGVDLVVTVSPRVKLYALAFKATVRLLPHNIFTQPSNPSRTVSMPDDVEAELYQHVVWMCENGYPVSWDSIKAVAWQLGKICRMQGEKCDEMACTLVF